MFDTEQCVQQNEVTAVFGKHVVSSVPATISGREELLRPNIIDLNFDFCASWFFLFLFLVFACSWYKKIVANVYFPIISFKRGDERSEEINGFSLMLTGFWMVALALCGAKIWQLHIHAEKLGLFFIIALAGMLLLSLLKWGVCYVIQFVTKQAMFGSTMFRTQNNVFFVMSFLLAMLFAFQTLMFSYSETLMDWQIRTVAICFLFYFVKIFFIFVREGIPLFFWILYVCSIEVLPLLFLYKMLVN